MAGNLYFFKIGAESHNDKYQGAGVANKRHMFEEHSEAGGGGIGEGHIKDIADGNAQNKRHTGFPAALEAVSEDGKDGWANGNRHK